MRKLIAVGLVAVVALVASTPASAATTHAVSAKNNYFDPGVVHAIATDTMRWTIVEGSHNVETYGGTMNFQSSMMSQASLPYEQTYQGGVVLYRCRPHSTLSASGICAGMCAAITDSTAPPGVPVIAQPRPGSSLGSTTVTFTGTGESWSVVRLTERGSQLGEALVQADHTWTVSTRLSTGAHTVAATAYNVDGTASTGSAQVTFSVQGGSADTTPPLVQITSDGLTVQVGTAHIDGLASDNVAVSGVTLYVTDLTGKPVTQATATCVSCPATNVAWTVDIPLPPGAYQVTAVAKDTSTPANVSDPAGPVFVAIA